jgi:hypothetical protein
MKQKKKVKRVKPKKKRANKLYKGLLKIDVDHKKIFKRTYDLIEYFGLKVVEVKKSPGKKGWHLKLKIERPITELEAILLQLMLGSDKKRETLNYIRWLKGADLKKWNILFDRKLSNKLLIKKLLANNFKGV